MCAHPPPALAHKCPQQLSTLCDRCMRSMRWPLQPKGLDTLEVAGANACRSNPPLPTHPLNQQPWLTVALTMAVLHSCTHTWWLEVCAASRQGGPLVPGTGGATAVAKGTTPNASRQVTANASSPPPSHHLLQLHCQLGSEPLTINRAPPQPVVCWEASSLLPAAPAVVAM